MRHAVIAAQWQSVVFEDGVKDRDEIHVVILPLAPHLYDIHRSSALVQARQNRFSAIMRRY